MGQRKVLFKERFYSKKGFIQRKVLFPLPAPLVFTPVSPKKSSCLNCDAEMAAKEVKSVENVEVEKVVETTKDVEEVESVESVEVEKVVGTTKAVEEVESVENVEVEKVVETAKEQKSDEEQESVVEKESVEENEKKEKMSLEERLRIEKRIRLLEEALRLHKLEKEKNKSPECRNCGEAFAADHQC